MKIVFALLVSIAGTYTFAAENQPNLIAIGQGISSPTLTSTVNFTSGYTKESPVGVIYQNAWRVTGEYDRKEEDNNNNDGDAGYGGEIGFGNGTAGIAVGYYTRDCDDCDGRVAGSVAATLGDVGLGIRAQEDLISLGVIFNPNGSHRFGFMVETDENEDEGHGGDDAVRAYGLGYSYVGDSFTFTVDASQRDHEDDNKNSERILLTPGLMVRASMFQVSVNDKITLNNDGDDNNGNDDDSDHEFWFGVGVGGESWHFAGYSNYVNELAFALSLFF